MGRQVATELRCMRDLALRLGAIGPETMAHHRELKKAGHLLVRDTETSWPMFWPWVPADMPHEAVSIRSS